MHAERKPWVGVLAGIAYIGLAGVGMAYSRSRGIRYGEPDMLDAFWPFLVALNLLNVAVVVRWFGWRSVGFGRLQARQLVWLVPFLALLAYKGSVAVTALAGLPADSPAWGRLAFYAAAITLVGTGEELAFRGIVLHAILGPAPGRGRVALAMLASAVGFALLHAVNVFGGQSVEATAHQLGYTFRWGLMFAPLMLRLRNIVPLMVVHTLWDLVQFTMFLTLDFDTVKYDHLQHPIELATAAVLWVLVLRAHRPRTP